MEEVETLVPRFQEVAKAQSRTLGRICYQELRFFYFSARLHEVLEICILCVVNPFTNPFTLIGP